MPLGNGYTKIWTPPVAPTPANNTNISIWRDIHNNLISSGAWIQTADAGQIDLDTFNAFPANNVNAGFKIYKLNDPWGAMGQIYMRVTFQAADLNLSGYYAVNGLPFTLVQVSYDSNFASDKTNLSKNPHVWTNSSTTTSSNVYKNGTSYICHNPNLGFFGMAYGVGSMSQPAYTSGQGCSFSIFIQRNLDDNQNVIPGFTVYSNRNTTRSGSAYWSVQQVTANILISQQYLSNDYSNPTGNYDHSPRQFGNKTFASQSGSIPVSPVYTLEPQVKQIPSMVSYNRNQITPGTQFPVEIIPGYPMNFIALGDIFGLYFGIDGFPAMLFQ